MRKERERFLISPKEPTPRYQEGRQELQQSTVKLQRQNTQQLQNTKAISLIFSIFFFCNLLINIDHGILPACTNELRSDLDLSDVDIGLLGSLVYLGLVIGSIFAMPIYSYCNTKFVLIVCLLCNSFFLILFTLTKNFYILSTSRLLVGFFQVFFCIYLPVWVDHFGDEKRKTIWLTQIILGVPLGVILGYICTSLAVMYLNWKWTFYIQAGSLVPMALFFMVTPAKFMVYSTNANAGLSDNDNSKLMTDSMNFYNLSHFTSKQPSHHQRGLSSNHQIQLQSQIEGMHSPNFGNADQSAIFPDHQYLSSLKEQPSIVQNVTIPELNQQQSQKNDEVIDLNQMETHLNQYEKKQKPMRKNRIYSVGTKNKKRHDKNMRRIEKLIEHYTLPQKIFYILTNLQFMLILVVLTGIYYISTGVQFWITDYFQQVLHISKEKAFISFAIAALTGPVMGVVSGGYVFNAIGGYNDPKCLPICSVVLAVGALCGFPVCFFTEFYLVLALLWIQFFCGGFTLPVLIGILLNCIPESVRTLGNAIANLFYNLFGYFPAPFVYGICYQATGSGESRWGLISLEIMSILGAITMFFAYLTQQASMINHNKKRKELIQSGASELIDNDQRGPLLSSSSDEDEKVVRRNRKIDLSYLSDPDNDDEDSENMDKKSIRTLSDRLKLESISVFYSKTMYPTSLGIYNDDD